MGADPIMLTTNQVAKRLEMNPYTVRELLRNGDLKGFKIGDTRWRVRESDLQEFMDRSKGSMILTTSQVARRLNLNPYTVRGLLRNGDLKGSKVKSNLWRIKGSDLDEFVSKYKKDYYA